jgi:hypothetical protein
MAIEVSDVRRRVRGVIESARKRAQERRALADRAAHEFEDFLRDRAVPMFQTVAAALVAEGHRFKVHTPAGSVRLASDANAEDFIDIALDTTADPPAVVGRTSRGRGRRLITAERPVREDVPVGQLTEEDVLSFLLTELTPFVER